MISKYDLYDITFALTAIRNNIRYSLNSKILSRIILVLECTDSTFEDNQIRKALASIEDLNSKQWYYVYHNNVYVNCQIVKNKCVYELLIKLCKELEHMLAKKDFERAYDLIDCFHCLPDIIADNNFIVPKSFWKTHMKRYRDKWDKTFLATEQKHI